MKLPTLLRIAGLLGLAFWLTGCTTISEVYPKFAEQSKGITAVAITADVLVLEDVRGPLPLVDVPRITALSAALNALFKAEFEKRGVAVVQVEHAGIGLRYSYSTPPAFKLRTTADAAEKPLEELGTSSAPYFVASAYTDPLRRGQLINVMEDLQRQKIVAGMTNLVSSAGRQLGPVDGATHRVFVLVEGVQIPMSKGLLQAIGTGLLTLGTVAVFEMTTVNFRVGVMDPNGEFIYISDCSIAGGWTVDEAYLKRQAGIFFAQFDRARKSD